MDKVNNNHVQSIRIAVAAFREPPWKPAPAGCGLSPAEWDACERLTRLPASPLYAMASEQLPPNPYTSMQGMIRKLLDEVRRLCDDGGPVVRSGPVWASGVIVARLGPHPGSSDTYLIEFDAPAGLAAGDDIRVGGTPTAVVVSRPPEARQAQGPYDVWVRRL